MKKICEECGKKFEVEDNPSYKNQGKIIIGRGTRHKAKLCDKCYYKLKKKYNSGRKGDKKFGAGDSSGKHKINTKSSSLGGYSKRIKEMLDERNNEIEKLYGIVERLSKENIRLKEEIQVMDYSQIAEKTTEETNE